MEFRIATYKTICIGVISLASSVNMINAQTSDIDSIRSDSTLFSAAGRLVSFGCSVIKDSVWEKYVDNIKSGDTITDPYSLNKITKDSHNFILGYAGSWLKGVNLYTKDGVKYEMKEGQNYYLAVAHLVSDSMKVWEVPDSFEYNGKMCYIPFINARPEADINRPTINDEARGMYYVNLTKVV